MDSILLAWETFKDWLSGALGLSHLELHLLAGILLFPFFAAILRRRLISPAPLLPLAGLELLNEVLDFTRYWRAGWPWQFEKTAIEVATTFAGPVVIMFFAWIFKTLRSRSAS